MENDANIISASQGLSPPHLVWLLGCLQAPFATGGWTPPPAHPVHPVLLYQRVPLVHPTAPMGGTGSESEPCGAGCSISPTCIQRGWGGSLCKGEHPGDGVPGIGAAHGAECREQGGLRSPLPPRDMVALLLGTSSADHGQPRRDRSPHPPLLRNSTGPGAAAALAREMPP